MFVGFGCDRHAAPADEERATAPATEEAAPQPASTAVEPRQDDGDYVVGNGALPERGAGATPNDSPTSPAEIAKRAAMQDAIDFGMIGLLNSGTGGDPDAPTAPWGRDDSLGHDAGTARGNMWGDQIGEAFGAGGLGLSGIGEGGAGRGEGVGLGSVGGIGKGGGTGTAEGFGSGRGRLGKTKPARIRFGHMSVIGSLAPEIVQRIVRSRMATFRACYQKGLDADPALEGRIALAFVIDSSGHVTSVVDVPKDEQHPEGTTLGDGGVLSCVQQKFSTMTFPAPEGGGVVKVRFQLRLSPGS
jgi:hypothetical protein